MAKPRRLHEEFALIAAQQSLLISGVMMQL